MGISVDEKKRKVIFTSPLNGNEVSMSKEEFVKMLGDLSKNGSASFSDRKKTLVVKRGESMVLARIGSTSDKSFKIDAEDLKRAKDILSLSGSPI